MIGEVYPLSLLINIQCRQRLYYCMIHLLHSRATKKQVDEMLETLGVYIKLAVDIKRSILAGGGALHADCEAAL